MKFSPDRKWLFNEVDGGSARIINLDDVRRIVDLKDLILVEFKGGSEADVEYIKTTLEDFWEAWWGTDVTLDAIAKMMVTGDGGTTP